MSDMGDDFREMRQIQQIKRAYNRESSAKYLAARGIPFSVKNGGAHLIVDGKVGLIDFWPGTGRWYARCGQKGFGVRGLCEFIGRRTWA